VSLGRPLVPLLWRSGIAVGGGLALVLMGLVGVAGTATITDFSIPTADSGPFRITAGPDGALWFIEVSANKIGRIVPDPVWSAAALLNGSASHAGQPLTYRATLFPASIPPKVDVHLGVLLSDLATLLSLVQVSPGVLSIAFGPAPVHFPANLTLTPLVVSFSYSFQGFEPGGTYIAHAGLALAGSNRFVPSNQLSLGFQPFQFSP
jgi:hypothetical protein